MRKQREQTTRQQVVLLVARAKQTCEVAEARIHGKQVMIIPNGYSRSYGKRHMRLRAKIDGEDYAYSQTATYMIPELVLKLDPEQIRLAAEAKERYEENVARRKQVEEAHRVRMEPLRDACIQALRDTLNGLRNWQASRYELDEIGQMFYAVTMGYWEQTIAELKGPHETTTADPLR